MIEADDGSSDADFLAKMAIALREAKEAHVTLIKVRLGHLDNHQKAADMELESEAKQLAAIFAAIIRNMRERLAIQQPARTRNGNW